MNTRITPDRDHLPWIDMTSTNASLSFRGGNGGGCDGDGSCGDGQSGDVGCGH